MLSLFILQLISLFLLPTPLWFCLPLLTLPLVLVWIYLPLSRGLSLGNAWPALPRCLSSAMQISNFSVQCFQRQVGWGSTGEGSLEKHVCLHWPLQKFGRKVKGCGISDQEMRRREKQKFCSSNRHCVCQLLHGTWCEFKRIFITDEKKAKKDLIFLLLGCKIPQWLRRNWSPYIQWWLWTGRRASYFMGFDCKSIL